MKRLEEIVKSASISLGAFIVIKKYQLVGYFLDNAPIIKDIDFTAYNIQQKSLENTLSIYWAFSIGFRYFTTVALAKWLLNKKSKRYEQQPASPEQDSQDLEDSLSASNAGELI